MLQRLITKISTYLMELMTRAYQTGMLNSVLGRRWWINNQTWWRSCWMTAYSYCPRMTALEYKKYQLVLRLNQNRIGSLGNSWKGWRVGLTEYCLIQYEVICRLDSNIFCKTRFVNGSFVITNYRCSLISTNAYRGWTNIGCGFVCSDINFDAGSFWLSMSVMWKCMLPS